MAFGDEAQLRASESPGASAMICRLEVEKGGARSTGVLYDAFGQEGLSRLLWEVIASRRRFHGSKGTLAGRPSRRFHRMRPPGTMYSWSEEPWKIVISKAEQSNSTVFYGDQFLLKIFRRLEEGVNPELEIETFLTEDLAFSHAPPLAGAIEYLMPRRTPVTIGVLEGYIHNKGDAWSYTLENVERYFDNVVTQKPRQPQLDSEGKLWLPMPELPASLLAQRSAGAIGGGVAAQPRGFDVRPVPGVGGAAGPPHG